MENGQQNKTAQYALIQSFYWMSFCVIFAYASVYLLDKGLSNTAIGLVIGISGTVSAVLQPWVGSLADGSGKASLKGIILLLGGLMMVLGICLLAVTQNRVFTVVCYGAQITLLQVLTPLIYALGMGCINRGEQLNFGLARGIGSLAYAVVSFAAGFLVASMGVAVIPLSIVGIYGVLVVAVLFFRYRESGTSTGAAAGFNQSGTAKGDEIKQPFFKRYHRFSILLAGGILVFVSHNMINNFAFQVMESKGGGSSAMGIAIALAAASELPVMFVFAWLVKVVSCDKWLKLSGLFFFVKAAATLLVTDVKGMYLIQGLQMFGFALFVVASVYYVNAIMEEQDQVKGQAFMTMTNTLGAVLGSTLGGVLIDGFGIKALLTVSAAAGAAGMVLMGVSAKHVPVRKGKSSGGR